MLRGQPAQPEIRGHRAQQAYQASREKREKPESLALQDHLGRRELQELQVLRAQQALRGRRDSVSMGKTGLKVSQARRGHKDRQGSPETKCLSMFRSSRRMARG